MGYREEFPDYPEGGLPPIPASWSDQSWRNDVCPSFATGNGWAVYVDYPDPEAREFPEAPRFGVHCVDADGGRVEGPTLETDDWSAVAALTAHPSPSFQPEA